MILEVRQPSPRLRPFIETFVFHQGYAPTHSKEILLPDGGIDLIIDLSEMPKHVYDNQTYENKVAFRHGWISGMRSQRIVIQVSMGAPMIVIRFKPGGAWSFFGFPMAELMDHVEEIVNIWGPLFGELRERLLEAPHHDAFFPILENFFLGLGRDRMEVHPILQFAVDALDRRVVPPSMRQLAERLGYSQKHVINLFEKHVGIPPKRYARIVRFQKLLHRLEEGPPQSWTDFAQSFGFYDQAHFINEFKAFSGLTPAAYLTRKGEYLNYIPVR